MNQTSPSPIELPGDYLGAEPLEGSGFEKEQPDPVADQEDDEDAGQQH